MSSPPQGDVINRGVKMIDQTECGEAADSASLGNDVGEHASSRAGGRERRERERS